LPNQFRAQTSLHTPADERTGRQQDITVAVVRKMVDHVGDPCEIGCPWRWNVDHSKQLPARVARELRRVLAAGSGGWLAKHHVSTKIGERIREQAVPTLNVSVDAVKEEPGHREPPRVGVQLLAIEARSTARR